MGEEDWKNYTIKVHALKSTSRLVGENEIAELAEQEEHAGDAGDIGFIKENHERLMEMYRGVKAKYGISSDSGNKEMPAATDDLLKDAYAALRDAAENFNYDELCDVLDVLNSYTIPPEHKQRIAAVTAAAESVDWGLLKQTVAEL